MRLANFLGQECRYSAISPAVIGNLDVGKDVPVGVLQDGRKPAHEGRFKPTPAMNETCKVFVEATLTIPHRLLPGN